MFFLRVTFILAVLLVIYEAHRSHCPHKIFMRLHLCTNCTDKAESVVKFAINVDNWREQHKKLGSLRVTIYTVFIGTGRYYPGFELDRRSQMCIFIKDAPKWKCVLKDGNWSCVREGSELASC